MVRFIQSAPRIFLLIFVLALLFISGRIIIPTLAIIQTQDTGGTIYFSASRSTVWSPNACVTLRWQVDNIAEVYLNGGAQIGSGEIRDCNLTEAPNLRVKFRDGSEKTYTLPVWVVSFSPIVPILVMWGAAAAFFYRYRFPRPSKILFVSLSALLILIGLYIQQLPALITIASALNWLEASKALADIFSRAGMIAFVALILVAHLLTNERQISIRKFLLLMMAGAAFLLLVVVGAIVSVNPRGMYFSDRFVAHQLILRDSKTQGYFALASSPDVVIMGSSRAFTLSPTYIREQTGLTAYNMAVEGGRIEDFLIQARQLHPFPKVLLIEVQDGLPRQPNDIASRAPLRWLPYMRPETALLTLERRLEGLIDLDQFAEAIHIANYAQLYERQPNEWPRFNVDGFAARPIITPPELEQAVLTDIGNIPPARCEGVDEISQGEVAQLIQLAESQNSALVFYISPLHPRYYDALMRDEPQYHRCHDTFTAYMNDWTQQYSDVFFLDFSQLASIDGADDETGYYDSQHLTQANSNDLIDHVAETLRRAAGETN